MIRHLVTTKKIAPGDSK